jgi:hypothetical protein
MTRLITRTSINLPGQFAIAVLIGACGLGTTLVPLQAQTAAESANLTYQLKETWIEGGGGSTTLQVHQAGDAAVALYESSEKIALVSNQADGIVSARPDRSLPILLELMDAPDSLRPGTELPMGNDWVHVIESISFQLERGDSDRTLEGHQAEHHVLTIDLKMKQVSADGFSNSEIATGRADLWTAPDLPFSWLPYNSPNGYPWALPLSFSYPEIAAHVLVELSDELLGIGLLLRAEIQSSTAIGDDAPKQEFIREVKVEGLEETAGPLDRTPFDKPVLTLSSYKSLMGGMMDAGRSCTQEVPAGSASLSLKTNKTTEISGEGSARVDPEAGMEGETVLILGSVDPNSAEPGPGCIVIITKPAGPEPGEYALAAGSDGWQAASTPKATAYFLRGARESPQVTLIEAGSLSIESAGDDKLQAELRGTGWTLNLTRTSASLIKDVAFELSFTVDALAVEEASADNVVPVPTEWTPLAFEPSASEPAAEWTFDGAGVSWGAIDSRGRYAAVALSSEPKVVLLDLESRSQLGQIDVKPDSGGKHVSSLAFGPSGNRLAIGLPMGRVRIIDTTTRETLQEIQYSKDGRSYTDVSNLQFDPAGGRVLGFTGNTIVAWAPDSGEVLSTWKVVGAVPALAVTPDGARAAMITSSEAVKILDIQTGSEICAMPGDFLSMAIHPAGDRFAAWSFEKKVVIASTADCSEIAAWPTTEQSFVPHKATAWAADGRHLILGSLEGPLHVYTEQGEPAGVWPGQGPVSLVFTSSGSNRVLSIGQSKESKAILWGQD